MSICVPSTSPITNPRQRVWMRKGTALTAITPAVNFITASLNSISGPSSCDTDRNIITNKVATSDAAIVAIASTPHDWLSQRFLTVPPEIKSQISANTPPASKKGSFNSIYFSWDQVLHHSDPRTCQVVAVLA